MRPCFTIFLLLLPVDAISWSWKPSQSISFCSFFDDIEFIFHLGDYLMLSAPKTSLRSKAESLFYLYDWRAGQLNGRPLEQSELFEQVMMEDAPDGPLVFATTFDLCSLNLDDRKTMRRRRKRQFDMGNEAPFDFSNLDSQATFERQKTAIMQELETKLRELRQNNKVELANAVMELKHQLTGLGKTLLLSQAQQRLLLSPMVMRSPPEARTSAPPVEQVPSVSADKLHEEMFAKLEALYDKLTNLTDNYNSNLPPEISMGTDFQEPKPPLDMPPPKFIDLQPSCPQVVLATFAHSQFNWEGRLCNDKRPPWLKTVLYQYEASPSQKTQRPTLTPMTLDEKSFSALLTYRGRIHIDDSRFVLLRNDLACPSDSAPKPINKLLAGFTLNSRMFVQLKKGGVSEMVNARYLQSVSIGELLNCYDNSSMFTLSLSVIGEPQFVSTPQQPPKKKTFNGHQEEDIPAKKPSLLKKQSKWEDEESYNSNEDAYKSLDNRNDDYGLGRKHKPKSKVVKSDTYRKPKVTPTKPSRPTLPVITTMKPVAVPKVENSVFQKPFNGLKPAVRSFENEKIEKKQPNRKKYLYYGGAALVAFFGYCCFCTSSEEIDEQNRRKRKKRHNRKKMSRKLRRKKAKNRDSDKDRFQRKRGSMQKRGSKLTKSRTCERSALVTECRPKSQFGLMTFQGTSAHQSAQVPPRNVTVASASGYQAQMGDNGAFYANENADLDQVIILDPEKVQQFCGADVDMANRFESMLGESRLISQLMEMKRCLGVDQLHEDHQEPEANNQQSSGQEQSVTGLQASQLSPFLPSPNESSPAMSMNHATEDESTRLIQVLHRMKKSLNSKTPN